MHVDYLKADVMVEIIDGLLMTTDHVRDPYVDAMLDQ
jgi:hypothetical protein